MSSVSQPQRLTYFFGEGQADGGDALKPLVGGKGASLAEMTKARLNVPPGFTISSECCDRFFRNSRQWPDGLEQQVRENLARLERLAGRTFGQGGDPLLVAVRSGAAVSMPGMMDTVLNVGLNPECVRAIAARTVNARAAWEAYWHFLGLFGRTVGGVEEAVGHALLVVLLRDKGKVAEPDLDAEELTTLCQRYREMFYRQVGRNVPEDPWSMLVEAVNAVFDSWNNERAVTYRRHHGIDGLLGTAVTVQMMCPAEVSGVMFTANPVNAALEQILIDSSLGLGEAVVLGKVTPDHFVLDKRSLNVIERTISKKEYVVATVARDGAGPATARDAASLTDAQLDELGRLGLRVEQFFGHPCDVEWALSNGEFFLLQARPVKRAEPARSEKDDADQEKVRREEVAALAARADPGGTVWSRYNLSEILPEPTPMTWALVRRFMSGRGGFGLMYRDLGFDPDPALDDQGIFDLVCGRPYYNLSREPRMQYRRLPFEHSFAALKANPARAVYPQPSFNPAKAGLRFWLTLPVFCWGLVRSGLRLQRLSRTFAANLRDEILPAFKAETEREPHDLSRMEPAALLERLDFWTRRTLVDFARDSLKPTVLAAVALGGLERALQKALGPEKARVALGKLTMGVRPAPEADLAGAVRDLAAGRLAGAEFLKRFGHRGSQEMELSRPRWAEDPAAVDRLVSQSGAGEEKKHDPTAAEAQHAVWEEVAAEAKLTATGRKILEGELHTLATYLGLRETAKHYLMMGYALIRRYLVELDQRDGLDGGVFFLTPEELPRLTAGEDFSGPIAERRRRRDLALSLEVPQVLFSDDLEAVGRAVVLEGATSFKGVPLSAGVAEGEALVLREPSAAPPGHPYVLVCPSTDPAWVPLFVHARALVMETGGVLSHGAIVARELGLPAVAGLPDVHRRLRSGQRLRVDGGAGTVTVLG